MIINSNKQNEIKAYILTFFLVMLWTIFIVSLSGFFHLIPGQATKLVQLLYEFMAYFTEVLLYASYIPLGIIFERVSKFQNKVLIAIVVCTVQFPAVLALAFIIGRTGIWPAEPYGLAMTFTIFTVWGFFLGVIMSIFFKRKFQKVS